MRRSARRRAARRPAVPPVGWRAFQKHHNHRTKFLRDMKLLVVGLRGTGVEIAKNLSLIHI